MKAATVKGYKIDFTKGVMMVNHKFAKAASQRGTEEYNLMREILREIPALKVEETAGRKTNTCHHDKNLTYKNMETYIRTKDNADELMAAYWIARTESNIQTSRYAYVRKWFISQFPNYREVPIVETTASIVAVPFGEEGA